MKEKLGNSKGELNVPIITRTRRPNGSLREQIDYSNCPSMTEQHTSHLTDLNYLVAKYTPDELTNYLMARNQYRQEILGHDFSQEPSMQDSLNEVYRMKQAFKELPHELTSQFKNHVEFLKYLDNPANQETLIRLGLLTKTEIKELTQTEITPQATPLTQTTQEDKANKEPKK